MRTFDGMYLGTVVGRDDPAGLGRIRFTIPGLIEPASAWALPLGAAGGGSQDRGLWGVPRLGAEVAVWFAMGNIEQPFYLPAHWAKRPGGVETPPEASTEATVLSTETFTVALDEASQTLRLRSRRSGDVVELDAARHTIVVRGTTSVRVEALGEIVLQAPLVRIGERVVRPAGEPI